MPTDPALPPSSPTSPPPPDPSLPSTHRGIPVSPGRVIGAVIAMGPPVSAPSPGERLAVGADPAVEAARIRTAASAVERALLLRAEGTEGESRDVLRATASMSADTALLEAAEQGVIARGLTADRALWEAGDEVAGALERLGGAMAERSADVRDVRARITAELRGESAPGIPSAPGPFVLAAVDLAPADTAELDPRRVLALVTEQGGPQSHTAILARQLGVPAVVAAPGVAAIPSGTEVFVDGARGVVQESPTAEHRALADTWAARRAQVRPYAGGGALLADGARIPLLANIGGERDADAALAAHADGVGLLRTEFLFLDRAEEPDLAEQTRAYTAILSRFPGRRVVVRTLDAGADKPMPFLTDASEPNPALGVRGYRTSWRRRPVLARQLAAIAAASAASGAETWVMAPMIATLDEVRDVVALCREHGLPRAGIMVETPAAALTADRLLAACDFASLGTNDLAQYAMAADRQLGELAHLDDPWQPAVLSLVAATCRGAESAGRTVGVCGEAAADSALAVVLVGLGADSLSMTPAALSDVAAVLGSVTLAQAQELAREALEAEGADDARRRVRGSLPMLEELGL